MYGDRRERFVTLREVPRRFYKFAMQHSSMIDRRLPTQVAPGNWPISSPRGRCRTELAEFAESHRTQSEMRSSTAQFAPAATREGAVIVCPMTPASRQLSSRFAQRHRRVDMDGLTCPAAARFGSSLRRQHLGGCRAARKRTARQRKPGDVLRQLSGVR